MNPCDDCGAPAILKIRTRETRRLCVRCADRRGRTRFHIPLGQWFSILKGSPQPLTQCPLCGSAESQIRETGLYGCAFCYEIFKLEQ